jgi:SM-20-related protein
VLLYLNKDWAQGDGGELAIYDSKDTNATVRIIPPLGGRVVVFWSDKRVPHAVLESHKDRFTVTLWFFHAGELREYRSKGGVGEE